MMIYGSHWDMCNLMRTGTHSTGHFTAKRKKAKYNGKELNIGEGGQMENKNKNRSDS